MASLFEPLAEPTSDDIDLVCEECLRTVADFQKLYVQEWDVHNTPGVPSSSRGKTQGAKGQQKEPSRRKSWFESSAFESAEDDGVELEDPGSERSSGLLGAAGGAKKPLELSEELEEWLEPILQQYQVKLKLAMEPLVSFPDKSASVSEIYGVAKAVYLSRGAWLKKEWEKMGKFYTKLHEFHADTYPLPLGGRDRRADLGRLIRQELDFNKVRGISAPPLLSRLTTACTLASASLRLRDRSWWGSTTSCRSSRTPQRTLLSSRQTSSWSSSATTTRT